MKHSVLTHLMNSDHDLEGIAILCRQNGQIQAVLRDDYGLATLEPAQEWRGNFDASEQPKADNFLDSVFQYGLILDWELNLPLADKMLTLRFAGAREEGSALLVGARIPAHISQICAKLLHSDLAGARRLSEQLAAHLVSTSKQAEFDMTMYDELTKLYNELATMQRELAKKNVQLEQTQQELAKANSELEARVALRTTELRQSKEDLEAILTNSPDAILLLSGHGEIERCNPAAMRLTDFDEDVLLGQPLTFLLEDNSAELEIVYQALHETSEVSHFEALARCHGKDSLEVEVAIAGIREEGELRNMVCTLRDIGPFKEVARMKDAIVATAAHELRTPLTTLQGFSEILLHRDLTPERQERYLTFVNQQALRLSQIVDDLLDLSRLESGRGLEIKPEPIDMNVVMQDAVAPFIESDNSHRIRLEVCQQPVLVYGDRLHLERVFTNLLSNAVKFSPEEGNITLSERRAGGYIELSVRDEGIGIAPKHHTRIFERFYRVNTSDNATSGTGLGLTICQLIVEMHGGQMWVESEEGRGSTFTFTIPLVGANATYHHTG